MAHLNTRLIKSVDYGDLDATDPSKVSCVVIYMDDTKEVVTTQARLIEIQQQIAAQHKSFLNGGSK